MYWRKVMWWHRLFVVHPGELCRVRPIQAQHGKNPGIEAGTGAETRGRGATVAAASTAPARSGLVLISLILFGGEVINEFAWLLLVGTIAGTYSSLTLAPAVVLAWENLAHKRKNDVDGAQRARLEPVTETRKRKAS